MPVQSPIDTPAEFNAIVVDGVRTPGICELKSGGDRKLKIEFGQSPGYAGAYSLFRGEAVPTMDYEIRVWEVEHFPVLSKLIDLLTSAVDARPPRILSLIDPSIAHNKINRVCVTSIGSLKKIKVGLWYIPISFSEWKKRKPLGGAPKPIDRLDTITQSNDNHIDSLKNHIKAERYALHHKK